MSRAGSKVSPIYLLCIEKNRKFAFVLYSVKKIVSYYHNIDNFSV